MNCDHKNKVNTEVLMYKPVFFPVFYTYILCIIL